MACYFIYPQVCGKFKGRFSVGAIPIALWLLYNHVLNSSTLKCFFYDEALGEFNPSCLQKSDKLCLSITLGNLQRTKILIAAAMSTKTQCILGGPAIELVRGDYERLLIPKNDRIIAFYGGWKAVVRKLSQYFGLHNPAPDWSAYAMYQSYRPSKLHVMDYTEQFKRGSNLKFSGLFSNIHSQLGCPYRQRTGGCGFCSRHRESVDSLPAKTTIQTLLTLRDRYDVKFCWETADEFFDDKSHLHNLIEMGICDSKVDLMIFCRLDTITKETSMLLAQCNVRYAIIGVESGVDRVLKVSNKGINFSAALKSMDYLKHSGIDIIPCFTIGHPAETQEEVLQTATAAKLIADRYKPPAISCSPIIPTPGSSYYGNVLKWRDFDLRYMTMEQLQEKYFTNATGITVLMAEKISHEIEGFAGSPVGIWGANHYSMG